MPATNFNILLPGSITLGVGKMYLLKLINWYDYFDQLKYYFMAFNKRRSNTHYIVVGTSTTLKSWVMCLVWKCGWNWRRQPVKSDVKGTESRWKYRILFWFLSYKGVLSDSNLNWDAGVISFYPEHSSIIEMGNISCKHLLIYVVVACLKIVWEL